MPTVRSIAWPMHLLLPNQLITAADFAVTVTASSGLPVTLTSNTPAQCVVNGGQVHLVATGPCTLVTSQAGDSVYNAASPVTRTFTILPADVPLQTLYLPVVKR